MFSKVFSTVLAMFLISGNAFAIDTHSTNMKLFGKSLPPIGYVQFCATGEAECLQKGSANSRLEATQEKMDMLSQVNSYVNGKIKPESDMDLYHVAEKWAYPVSSGDCEDYVLLKKRFLEGMGVSPDQLLITVLLDEKNEGHAVLTVVTTAGDFVLDNRRDMVLPWVETNYKFLKRQSQDDPKIWVSLRSKPTQVLVSSKKSYSEF
jgi:predicted transglutaminase-like cysteine proteinase